MQGVISTNAKNNKNVFYPTVSLYDCGKHSILSSAKISIINRIINRVEDMTRI